MVSPFKNSDMSISIHYNDLEKNSVDVGREGYK